MAANVQYTRIVGNVVELVTEVREKAIDYDDFIKAVTEQEGIDTGILPSGLIYFKRYATNDSCKKKRCLYIFEQSPRKVAITYKHASAGSSDVPQQRLKISLPFVYIAIPTLEDIILQDDIRVFCSTTKIKNEDDSIFVIPLPNIYGSGHGNVCVGDIKVGEQVTFSERVEATMRAIFHSEFNTDLSVNYPEEIGSMKKWDAETKKNPIFGLTVNYANHDLKTLKGVIDLYEQRS